MRNELIRIYQKLFDTEKADVRKQMENAVSGSDIGRAREQLGIMRGLEKSIELLNKALDDLDVDDDDDKDDDKPEEQEK